MVGREEAIGSPKDPTPGPELPVSTVTAFPSPQLSFLPCPTGPHFQSRFLKWYVGVIFYLTKIFYA